ncbi:hypothetical protein HXX76_015313 [Chlamydomonas incerta]|uniref:Uncharacterized protein n=1 Tax=Chlamydomonas incerta TaxID=51695 RepID=A0A835SA02_CHLIN|nr:hypothetical protein HXX76_015313 [Chlamydomonas incerta]|eukprot:KAG2423442.1 hypothetical protein HXX76_015313 [Chlamydomonas incerta]
MASGRRERRWALLAVLVIAAAASASDKYAPVKGVDAAGRSLLAAKAPEPCFFQPETGTYEAACSPSQEYIATIKTKGMSTWAKSIIQGSLAESACEQHNTSATCLADMKNYCGWAGSDGGCGSGLTDKLQINNLCPGSIYAKSQLCLAKRCDECGKRTDRSQPDSDGCVVSDWGAYWGKSQYEEYGPADEKLLGGPYMFGACMMVGELAARLGTDHEFNMTSYSAWNRYAGGDATNITDFYRARGNCSYAQNAVARNAYAATCTKQNQVFPDVTKQVASLNTSSVQALTCAATGCATMAYNGTRSAARFAANKIQGIAPVYLTCKADTAIMWSTRLNPKTDGLLYRQYQLCYSSIRQRKKALCEGAVLF